MTKEARNGRVAGEFFLNLTLRKVGGSIMINPNGTGLLDVASVSGSGLIQPPPFRSSRSTEKEIF